MVAIIMSTCMFLLFTALGNLLWVLNETAYVLVVLYPIFLLFSRMFYQTANCRALEIRDFLITLVIVCLFLSCYGLLLELFDFTTFWYLYLTTFISLMLYADSIRFKSLM